MRSWTEFITLIATVLTAGWAAMYLTQAIKRVTWRSSTKLILAIIVSALFGLAAAWLDGSILHITKAWGNLTAADILAFGGVVYTAAATWYHKYFNGTGWMNTVAAFPAKSPPAK